MRGFEKYQIKRHEQMSQFHVLFLLSVYCYPYRCSAGADTTRDRALQMPKNIEQTRIVKNSTRCVCCRSLLFHAVIVCFFLFQPKDRQYGYFERIQKTMWDNVQVCNKLCGLDANIDCTHMECQ